MELEDNRHIKTWQQWQTNIKNLTQKYRKVIIIGFGIYLSQVVYLNSLLQIKDHNNISGNNREDGIWVIMDAILGTRHSYLLAHAKMHFTCIVCDNNPA